MAISDVDFTKQRRRFNGAVYTNSINNKATVSSSPKSLGIQTGSIYLSDNNTTTPSPVNNSLQNAEDGDLSENSEEYINKFKTCDLRIVSLSSYEGMSWNVAGDFGNWRNYSDIIVNNNVILYPDSKEISLSYKYEWGNTFESVLNNKIFSTVSETATMARLFGQAVGANSVAQGVSVPKYKKVPAFKDADALSVPSSIKFNFQFGQAGLFSAEQEVVRPIIALAKIFAPYNDGSGSFLKSMIPSNEEQMSIVASHIAGTVGGALKALLTPTGDSSGSGDGTDTAAQDPFQSIAGGIASKATAVQNALMEGLNSAMRDALSRSKGVQIRFGRFCLPACVVGGVNFNFDFSKVDDYGFPYKGYLELTGLESTVVVNQSQFSIAGKNSTVDSSKAAVKEIQNGATSAVVVDDNGVSHTIYR